MHWASFELGALIIPVKGTSAWLIHTFRPDTARSLLCSYTDSFPNEIHVTLCSVSLGRYLLQLGWPRTRGQAGKYEGRNFGTQFRPGATSDSGFSNTHGLNVENSSDLAVADLYISECTEGHN